MAISITPENFNTEVMQSSQPVVVDVYATWCGPCQLMMPIVEELEKELSSKVKFAKMNVDDTRDLTIQFGITSVPTFLFIKDGNIKHRETGYMSKEALKEKIDALLNANN
jgi:thioredoxin 1